MPPKSLRKEDLLEELRVKFVMVPKTISLDLVFGTNILCQRVFL